MSWNDFKHLQVYAQHSHHHESFIVGNKQALIELRDLIDQAIKEGEAMGDFFPSDGEGYQLYISLVNDEHTLNSLEMPYTEQYGEKNEHFQFLNLNDDPKSPYHPVTLLKKEED